MKPLGLQRGERESKATHTSVKQYYSAVNEFCGGGVDSVISDLKSQIAQLTQRLSKSEKNLGELRLERDGLRKQLDEKVEEFKAETLLLQVTPPEIEKIGGVTTQSAAKPLQLSAAELIAQGRELNRERGNGQPRNRDGR